MLFLDRLVVVRYPGLLAVIVCLLTVSTIQAGNAVYQTREQFLRQTFGEQLPDSATLWVIDETAEAVETILGHPFGQLRVRYWLRDNRSAWVLEEIGKVLPITFGVVIEDYRIASIHVMTYRESRGAEVRFPFFTEQFEGVFLKKIPGRDVEKAVVYQLSDHIDGISGATLSVRAMTRIAQLALYFHSQLEHKDA